MIFTGLLLIIFGLIGTTFASGEDEAIAARIVIAGVILFLIGIFWMYHLIIVDFLRNAFSYGL